MEMFCDNPTICTMEGHRSALALGNVIFQGVRVEISEFQGVNDGI
jgi:hypothetical protein